MTPLEAYGGSGSEGAGLFYCPKDLKFDLDPGRSQYGTSYFINNIITNDFFPGYFWFKQGDVKKGSRTMLLIVGWAKVFYRSTAYRVGVHPYNSSGRDSIDFRHPKTNIANALFVGGNVGPVLYPITSDKRDIFWGWHFP